MKHQVADRVRDHVEWRIIFCPDLGVGSKVLCGDRASRAWTDELEVSAPVLQGIDAAVRSGQEEGENREQVTPPAKCGSKKTDPSCLCSVGSAYGI
jgi:hypothetical protein